MANDQIYRRVGVAAERVIATSEVGLIGDHNRENIVAAIAAVTPFGIGVTPIAESIKTGWEMLGITTNIRVIPELTADFTVLLVAQQIPIDPDQYNLWHSTQTGTNLTKFNRPRADKLLEDGRKTTDLKTRKAIYTELYNNYLWFWRVWLL